MLTMTLNLMKPTVVTGDPRASAAWSLVGAVFTMVVVALVAGLQ